jgi:hypothetical protein
MGEGYDRFKRRHPDLTWLVDHIAQDLDEETEQEPDDEGSAPPPPGWG